ncbi:MAG: mechanosensitive ion channel family protein [Xanthobacteraceae bacterium]
MAQSIFQDAQSKLNDPSAVLSFAPSWMVSGLLLVVALAVAFIVHAIVLGSLRRIFADRRPYLSRAIAATKNPTRLALLLAALAIALSAAPLGTDIRLVVVRCLILATICLIGWIALIVLHIAADFYLRNFSIDAEDNLLARKHITQVRVMVRALDTIIILLTLGFALMTFDEVRQYGVSLFASAGVAGVIFGLAAQPVLSNLIAGIQLAITQPIRIEDAVTVQNEYGWIEEINATYVVIRLWDLRRLIVPLNYFIQQPFYNWTRSATANIGNVVLYLDYTAPIERIRAKAVELVGQSAQPGAKLVNLQAINATPNAVELRMLLTAASTGTTADLCAEIREKLIGFLQRECPQALPRQRYEMTDSAASKDRKRFDDPHGA